LPIAPSVPTRTSQVAVWIAATLGIVAIGGFDYATGIELRVFPFYFLPISLLAWHAGRSGALVSAVLSAAAWEISNLLGGLDFSHPGIWIGNTVVQAVSFATVGLLIATLKGSLLRERGLSRTDPLTALLNSRAFFEEAARILSLCRRQGRPVTLAYVDLDNFKAVNDRLGHQAGDDLLCSVAVSLKASTRPSDLCARLGGDEFVVLLPETDSHEASGVLERLRSTLSETVAQDRNPVTCSIGAVTFPTVPDNLEEMIRSADSSMYAAKTEGKDRVHHQVVSKDGA
jgi:diguanylate cyclase (GGDEF)-like protein